MSYKYLLCLSSMIRGFEAGLAAFKEANGVTILVNLLHNDLSSIKLKRRIIFLLRHIFFIDHHEKNVALSYDGLIPTLVSLLGHEDIDVSENSMATCKQCFSRCI